MQPKRQREDGPIISTAKGFSQECEWMTLAWDHSGKYIGQWQDDMIDGDGMIFIGAHRTDPIVEDLTTEQMTEAKKARP